MEEAASYNLVSDGDIVLVVVSNKNRMTGSNGDSKLQYDLSVALTDDSLSANKSPYPMVNMEEQDRISENQNMALMSFLQYDQPPTDTADTTSNNDPTLQIIGKIRVSSAHLTLSCPYFLKMFKNDWREAKEFQYKGYIEIPVEEFDLGALLIVMRVIHGQHWQLPDTLTIEQLTYFAVIVDYYGCFENVDIFADKWILSLEPSIPTILCLDIVRWLCVSRIFRRAEIFNKVTQIMQSQCEGRLDCGGLPISSILDAIEQQRQALIAKTMDAVNKLLQDLRCSRTGCGNYSCNVMLFGSLMIGMEEKGLTSPDFTAPFFGYSFQGLLQIFRSIETPCWYSKRKANNPHQCSIQEHIEPLFGSIAEDIAGLHLHDY